MKIVINTCFGGFGLSDEAILELAKRGYSEQYYDGKETILV